MKRIGIITSGGDCSGLNAAIRAITLKAVNQYGLQVYGFKKGTVGLLKREYINLTPHRVGAGLLARGGTILGAINKGNPFSYPIEEGVKRDISAEIVASCKAMQLDGLISIGGDGSFSIMNSLAQKYDLKFVGIPKTIDNDLSCTDFSIGFMTSVSVVSEAIDKLHSTAQSHERVMVVQVMGRDAGHLALYSGISGAADIILIPEIPYSLDVLKRRLKKIYKQKRYAMIVVSEAVKTVSGTSATVENKLTHRERYDGIASYLANLIEEETHLETRSVVLGHIQRGGTPIPFDRIMASQMGVYAVDLAVNGLFGNVVVYQNNTLTHVPVADTINRYNKVDINSNIVQTARGLGICLGDT